MPLGAALLLTMLAALVASPAAVADDALTAAHALLSAWHEDPARIDRARALLETAAAPDTTGDTLAELSHVWFLTGDFRARGEAERVTAYERGAEAAKRAIALAPRNDRAHLWLAINSGRIAEIKGVGRALALVGTIREESETVLKINPANVEGLVLAGGLAAQMPVFMGGDRGKAETLFKRALEIDPRLTGGRMQLAQLYMADEALARRSARAAEHRGRGLPHGSCRLDDERPPTRQGPAHRAPRPRPDPDRPSALAVALRMGGHEMAPHSDGGLDRAPKPPALVTPRGTRGAPRCCVPAGYRSPAAVSFVTGGNRVLASE